MRKSELDQTGPDVNLRVSAGLQESGGGAARLQRSSGLHLADGVCGASIRAGPGEARPPNEFWCIFCH